MGYVKHTVNPLAVSLAAAPCRGVSMLSCALLFQDAAPARGWATGQGAERGEPASAGSKRTNLMNKIDLGACVDAHSDYGPDSCIHAWRERETEK